MRAPLALIVAVLAGCSGQPYRMGSPVPSGAELTPGRIVEGEDCDFFWPSRQRFARAYRDLRRAAGKDVITDVEVAEDSHCTYLRAKAVKIAPDPASTTP